LKERGKDNKKREEAHVGGRDVGQKLECPQDPREKPRVGHAGTEPARENPRPEEKPKTHT
jgi:hypothetical protein